MRAYWREAADTLRRPPSAILRPKLTYWPEIVSESATLLGSKSGPQRAAPRPAAIDRLDTVLSWLLVCIDEERRTVWARACRLPWRRLSEMDGRSHMTLRKIEARAAAILRHVREESRVKAPDHLFWNRK